MKYTINEKKGDSITIDFEISKKEWEADVEAGYQKTKGNYKKEGFRPGKVPRQVIENMYGETVFYEDAFNEAFPKYYTDMLKKEKNLFPIDYPEISVKKMDASGVSFSATIVVLPEFEVKKYTGFKVEKKKPEVKKAEITRELENLRERHARFVDVTDREVAKGDLINLNYSGSIDGVKFDGGTAQDQELEIGSNTFIPGFEDQLIGAKIGEDRDIKVTFPTEYHSKELAGKEAVFACKILSIRQKELPKLDDEFAKEVSEFDSLNALQLSIEEKLSHEKEHMAQHQAEDELIKQIVDNVELNIPEKMVQKQLDYLVKDLGDRLAMQGLTLQGYFDYMGTTEEQFRKERKKDAERSCKTSLVLEEIIKKEKITVTEEDLEAKYAEIANMYGQKVDELKKMLNPQAIDGISQEIMTNKVIALLIKKNEIA